MSAEGPKPPSEAELAEMDRDELLKLGGQLDGVEIVDYPEPWPVEGTRAERRAQRLVAFWFALSALAGLAFVVVMAWPKWWEYKDPSDPSGHSTYSLYTPALGVTLGLAVLSLGIGVILYTKKFVPHETSVQQRSDGPSAEVDRATILAHLADAGTRNGIARRSLIKRTAGAGAGALGLAVAALPIASFIKDPWKDTENKDGLWHTGWLPNFKGEKVYLRRNTGNLEADVKEGVALVKAEDLDAGAMETVFPYRESEKGDEKALSEALMRVDNPVMLIRLRSTDAARVVKRKGQEDFNFGDYYAYTKICSHVGCPTSLYEQRTNRILCPCHQSQFDALHYAKPIFGPATRPLAQLPITVDEEGYLIAKGDFIEAIGPAFWERKS
ncbi:ubiquinol-cytochrome c reductase iron-sulfur subunit [Amycolatopsis rubida]|uniref:Cytochrome bc1 complex Rieske iron-sulfur subunit n=1 Tax=Amycolatopsis rubida TaxID=112413 RepID=A0A1I5YMR1_9PSEU|nr:ubiquinol-cytochrome c reductase iron-sulfur subunit [Amycolatopsis rubida]MYW95017.1 Rieske 2Fe-2S domain-containing protein [Amycolatopsis rubida]NEC60004.1 ubiquinol-cytochrome c reductase iron-sulfur subunit [Amycolatopsis rubida]SFQ45197.1 ubiquinol-cytochrome c reductase iron-sulfur subunit [Amycolatopsis rubida]